jgi:hypothetical protein
VSTVVLIAVCEEEKDEHLLNDEEKKRQNKNSMHEFRLQARMPKKAKETIMILFFFYALQKHPQK